MYIIKFYFSICSKNTNIYFLNMFIYTEIYIESRSNTKNINFLYKTHPTHHDTFSTIQLFKNPYFQELDIHSNQRLSLIFMARLWRA